MIRRILPFAAVIALTLGLGACKSPEEKACANLMEIGKKLGEKEVEEADAEKKCVEQFAKLKEQCSNGDEVLGCIADMKADNAEKFYEEFSSCREKCKNK